MLFRRVAALAFALTLAAQARADVPPPDTTQCNQLQVGDACLTDGRQDGACAKSRCSKLVALRGGTVPPESFYDCVACVAGAPRSKKASKGCGVGGDEAGDPSPLWLVLGLSLLRRRRARSRVVPWPRSGGN